MGSGGREGGWVNPNLPTPPVHTAHTRTPNTQPPARALTLCVGYYTAAVLLQPVSWSICACPPPSGPSSRAHRPRAIPHAFGTRSSAACATQLTLMPPLPHAFGTRSACSGVCHAAVTSRMGRMRTPPLLFFASPPLSCRVYYNNWGDRRLPPQCLLTFVPRAAHSSYPPIHVRPFQCSSRDCC